MKGGTSSGGGAPGSFAWVPSHIFCARKGASALFKASRPLAQHHVRAYL